jgi:hypothetical protein
MKNFICHSGGCPGADMAWETVGEEFNVKTIAYSFSGHTQYGKNPKVLTTQELEEGLEHVIEASKTLKRNVLYIPRYVKGLLCRNWFQVKNSDTIFAVGRLISKSLVDGGTGWAVQMAVDNKKPVFFFNQPTKTWNKFNYDTMEFDKIDYIPKLTENFAGVGTREIDENGKEAIRKVYHNNFEELPYMQKI